MSDNAKQEALNNFGDALFKLSGLYDAIPDLVDAFEEDIAGSYEAIKEEYDDEDSEYDDYTDPKDNRYGGHIFETYQILKNGKPIDELNYCDLSEKQKVFLNKLSSDGEMSLSVHRTDFEGQDWGIAFSVPKTMSEDAERFDIFLTIKINSYHPKKNVIEVGTKEDIDADALNKLSLMFQLKYS